MQRNNSVVSWLIAVSLVLVLTAGIASAATETNKISFSGNLTSAVGTPLTGTYTVTFRLYNVASGGTALATDTHTVTAAKGLYTTTLNFPASIYNGQQLYVGIQRSPDAEKSPRTVLYPASYALSLRPGAVVSGSTSTSPVLRLAKSDNSGQALYATTSGTSSDAVRGYASGTGSRGVYGESSNGVGVYGKGKEGGYFTTSGAGSSWNDLRPAVNISTQYAYNPGIRIHTSNHNSNGLDILTENWDSRGINVRTLGQGSAGIWVDIMDGQGAVIMSGGDHNSGVRAATMGNYSDSISAITFGNNSNGVYAETRGKNSPGIDAFTQGSNSKGANVTTKGPNSQGIHVETLGIDSYGVHSIARWRGMGSNAVVGETYGDAAAIAGLAHNTSVSASFPWGLYGSTDRSDGKYGVYTPDRMSAFAYDTNAGDVAEFMPVSGDLAPGMVVVIGDDGKLQKSATAYDTKVAGIISTNPGVALGTKEAGNPGEAQIAVAGRVPCLVDASKAPIHAGDLLTTSDNPGYAMKAEQVSTGSLKFYLPGTVLGKSMGSLDSGTGTIEVLVTLQ